MLPTLPSDGSAWPARLPPFLGERVRRAASSRLSPGERVRQYELLGFAAIRTIVAILASAHEATRVGTGSAMLKPLVGLDRLTWGGWVEYAIRLADAIDDATCPPVARPFVDAVRRPDIRNQMGAIVKGRNEIAHGDHGARLSDGEASERAVSLVPAVRAVTAALRPLLASPIGWLESPRARRDSTRTARLVVASGEPDAIDEIVHPDGCPDEVAFLLGVQGDLLLLDPWIEVRALTPGSPPTCGLLSRTQSSGAASYEAGPESSFELAEGLATPSRNRVFPDALPTEILERIFGVDTEAPDRVGPFLIERQLGRGATATVWLGRDSRPGATHLEVAVKVLRPELARLPEVRTRLRREFQLASQLTHAGIVRALEQGVDDRVGPWVAMECVHGETLADHLALDSVEFPRLIRWTCEILDALATAHARRVVHRDVKPSNILIDHDHARLVDFGLARIAEPTNRALTVLAAGTPRFSAPEQLSGLDPDARADVYAVGKVVEWAIGDRPPPPKLAAVLVRATQTNPADRFPTAEAFLAALRADDLLDSNAPPVHPGDRLGRFQILSEPDAVAPGVWVVEGIDPDVGPAPVGLLIGVPPSGDDLVFERLRSASKDVRALAGAVHGNHAVAGFRVAVLDVPPWLRSASLLIVGKGDAAPPVSDEHRREEIRPATPDPKRRTKSTRAHSSEKPRARKPTPMEESGENDSGKEASFLDDARTTFLDGLTAVFDNLEKDLPKSNGTEPPPADSPPPKPPKKRADPRPDPADEAQANDSFGCLPLIGQLLLSFVLVGLWRYCT